MPTLTRKRRMANSVIKTRKPLDADAAATPKQAPTKQSIVVQLLSRKEGVAIDGLVEATGWQRHSVRGFLAGVVRKRLRLKLVSTVVDGQRIYRIDANHNKPNRTSGRRQA